MTEVEVWEGLEEVDGELFLFPYFQIYSINIVEEEDMEAVKTFHFVEYGEFPIEEIPVDEVEEDALNVLRRIKVEKFQTSRGIIQKLSDNYGHYVGKIVGDYSIEELNIGSAYQTAFGIKVTLDYNDKIVGWLYLPE